MSAQHILETDWTDYDNRKLRNNPDARFFACTEPWEREYLITKIKALYPTHSRQEIVDAIDQCCKTTPAPHPRQKLVECVMHRLGHS
jgi:hypothetical protein